MLPKCQFMLSHDWGPYSGALFALQEPSDSKKLDVVGPSSMREAIAVGTVIISARMQSRFRDSSASVEAHGKLCVMTGRNHLRSLRIARSLHKLRIVYRLLDGGMPPEPRVISISDAKLQRVWNRNIFSQEVD